jgi:transposase
MTDIQTIFTERVDDIPLLIEQMKRMDLPTLIDHHVPVHGNWKGLSLGWVCTVWLSSILSRGDHRLSHVEPWVETRRWTFETLSDQEVESLDFTDDRLEAALRYLSDDERWAQLEKALNEHTVRVYDLPTERVHVDSTTASTYAGVTEGGLFQLGHSKDHRPDLPQVKVMQAVLDPLGMPLATDVVSGERADDPLYLPCIERVQSSLGRHGVLFVGDCKMAARDTRAVIAMSGDYYLCPLPQPQLADGELDEALERIWNDGQALSPVFRADENGEAKLIAEGYERTLPMRVEINGESHEWNERRLIVRSSRHAEAAEAALRARVSKAKSQVEALNRRGRGRKRFEDTESLRQAVIEIVQRHRAEDFLWLRFDEQVTTRSVRAYKGQAGYIKEDRQATVEVASDDEALEAAIRRLGWRIYSTNQPDDSLSLEQAVVAYRSEYLVERSLGRLKGRPLSLRPMYVHRDDHATGLIRLLSIALRVLTLLEFTVRRGLAAEDAGLTGLYAGNAKRKTARPTAERLLEAFDEVTLTVIEIGSQVYRHVTALSPVQERILELLGFSSRLYARLCTVSHEPL